MKLPVPSRKVRLVLSILFLLFSLVFYWWAVGSPMPTPGLAHRAALLSYGLTPGPVEAQWRKRPDFDRFFPGKMAKILKKPCTFGRAGVY